MKQIIGSVGEGGMNYPLDVLAIQELLSRHSKWISPYQIKPNGKYSELLASAIFLFKANACAFELKNIDSLIKPGDFTLKRLNQHLILRHIHP